MPITAAQKKAAQALQQAAARDKSDQVRLVAGPGTGKSFVIEDRVCDLLSGGVKADQICAVSFTRASALDLRSRIRASCLKNGHASGNKVRVSTLHSLALTTLQKAGLLHYPTDPQILDPWELETIFDAEFGESNNIAKRRRAEVRRNHEAFWSTGTWGPPNYVPPNPPISTKEKNLFKAFHTPRSQVYSCVLPGELIRQCVAPMRAGTLDPVSLLGLEHLIVDEYQDLNPVDLEFIDLLVGNGAKLFVAGDDDQSIYSFRYASPSGIQKFTTNYPKSGKHSLQHCFRCTPDVLSAGQALIAAHASGARIPKNYVSLYAGSTPPVQGVVHRWRFASDRAEAKAIAESCRDLISAGMNPREIMVLLSNQNALGKVLYEEFERALVDFEPARSESFLDTETGRFVLCLIRIICNDEDYIAHRGVMGALSGVGIGTCNAIAEKVASSNLNFRSLFYQPIPGGVFNARELSAINETKAILKKLKTWTSKDELKKRRISIRKIVSKALGASHGKEWKTFARTLPKQALLEEVRDFMWADTDEQQATVLEAVYERLGVDPPAVGVLPRRVRVMTMHGAKGLSACIVFIPGLEDQIHPGKWRSPYPGLVEEGARMLYVSITRGKAACVVSYTTRRFLYGQVQIHSPSRYCTNLGGTFGSRTGGLDKKEVQDVLNDCAAL